jgi:hypothetical protein
MGKSERVEGQESLQKAGGSAGYLRSATTFGSTTTRQFLHQHICYNQYSIKHKSFTKQQFVITHQNTILQEREKLDRSFTDQHVSMSCFYKNIKKSNISVDTPFREQGISL